MGRIIYTLGCQVSDFGIFDVVRVVHVAAVFLAKDLSSFTLSFVDALDAYDTYVIQCKGKATLPTDLNRPEKWTGSSEQPDS